MEELYDVAEGTFLEKMDFCAVDWLYEKDRANFIKLYKELNLFCPVCGKGYNEKKINCHCK